MVSDAHPMERNGGAHIKNKTRYNYSNHIHKITGPPSVLLCIYAIPTLYRVLKKYTYPSLPSKIEARDAQLVEAHVVCELVPDRADHLVAQQVGAVPEVAAEGISEDDDPVVGVLASALTPLV